MRNFLTKALVLLFLVMPVSGALNFNGATDRLSTTTNLPTITSFTMMGWFKISAHTDYQTFLSYGDTAATGGDEYYDIGTNASEVLTTYNGVGETNGSTLTPGTWYHVSMTVSGTGAGQFLVYLNGALNITSSGASGPSAEEMQIGNDSEASEELIGDAGCIKVYSAVLTASEIQNEMFHCRPMRTANLSRWSPLLNSGEPSVDFSGNGFAWTVGGTLTTVDGPPISW